MSNDRLKAPFPYFDPEIVRRFWEKVDGNDPSGCWIWTASKRSKGYGAFAYTWDGKVVHDRAHRFSYGLHNGHVPDDLFVLHECDNPPCVNPDHLFLGTNQDNVDDMMSKGRHVCGATHKNPAECDYPRGTGHHAAKVNEDIVRAIRAAHASGEYSYSRLSRKYRLGIKQCWKIVNREAWVHVD